MERAQILLRFHDEAVLVLLGELSRGPDDVVDKLGQIHRLGIDFELPPACHHYTAAIILACAR
jgi:hypothetical protein